MLTVGKLARLNNLSRSTLLYYDRIGLLTPSGRTPANYRVYNDDAQRLKKICLYRRAGLGLSTIADVLDAGAGSLASALEQQLSDLNHRISNLRQQQHLIIALLKGMNRDGPLRVLDKANWVRLLRRIGLDEDDMRRWHQAFEQLSPEAHHNFRVSLGVAADEAAAIRQWSLK